MKISILLLMISFFSFAEPSAEVDFKVTMGPTFTATTKSVKGKVVLKNDEYIAQNIIVDLKTLSSKMDLRDDHMKNKYLEVEKYPEAILVFGKGKDGKGVGKIKIRGIEKEIKGTYLPLNSKEVEAKFELSLSDFNIKAQYKGIGVKDIISLRVVVPLEKSAAVAPPATAATKPKKN